jgi:muconate cycloisomerase
VNVDFDTTYTNAAAFLPVGSALTAIGNIHILEDPLPATDLAGYALLSRELAGPVAITLDTPELIFAAARADAGSYVNTTDGPAPTSMQRFTINAAVAHKPVWHNSGCELGILDAALIHMCAAAANCTLPSDIVSHLRVHDLLAKRLEFQDGFVDVPKGPGLGVELDEDAVRRFKA